MAKLSIVAGATSQSVNVFIQNSSVTTGAGLTGLVFNTSGLTAYYSFAGANATSTSITLATLAAVNSAYSSGGFKELDSTNMPGVYRLDLPNAVLATSKGQSVVVFLQGAANMSPCVLEIELTAWNNQDGVHGGLSCLPNTACTTNASLLTSGTGTDQLSVSAGKTILQATQTGVTIPTVTTVTNQLTAAQVATGIWQDTTAGDFTVASSIGKSLYTSGSVPGASGGLFIAGSNAATTVNVTGNLTGNVSGSVGSVTGGVTVTTNNDKTGYSLTQAFPSNFSSLSINGSGQVSPLSNIKKNTALAGFSFTMTDATTGNEKTGLTVTSQVAIDGGSFVSTTNSVVEMANGWYKLNLAAADLNGNNIALRFTASGATTKDILIITQP